MRENNPLASRRRHRPPHRSLPHCPAKRRAAVHLANAQPTLEALTKLGGSGSIEELDDAITAAIGASQEQLDVIYPKSGAAVLPDRVAWARSFLKLPGLVANPKRGVWVLTEEGRAAAKKSNAELKQIVSAAYKSSLAIKKRHRQCNKGEAGQDVAEGAVGWSDMLLQRMQTIDPAAFERLSQRLLRESGILLV